MNTTNYNAREAEQRHLLQVYGQADFEPVAAEGVTLTCRDGRTLIDMYGGHAVASLGYAHPDLLAALDQQARQLFFQSNAVALEVRAQAADKLARAAGMDRVFFGNSGAEANENALRVAFKKTGRSKVVALEHGFHGRTTAAAAATWGARDTWYGFPEVPFEVAFAPRDNAARAAGMIDGNTAAVILELVQGIAGAYDLAPEFVAAVAAACREHGALLIVDEVQTGVGRPGEYFAAQVYDVAPDILTTAKALGGGFPCSAVMLSDEVADCMQKGDLGTTFGGGPLAAGVICAVLDVIERDGLLANVQRLSARMQKECVTGPVERVSGKGFLLGLHCPDRGAEVRSRLLEQGILTGTSNDADIIRLLPPLILADEHVDALVTALHTID